MSDLIKREDAIKAIENLPNAYNGWSDAYDKAYIIQTLEEVPSAESKPSDLISREDAIKAEWNKHPNMSQDECEAVFKDIPVSREAGRVDTV